MNATGCGDSNVSGMYGKGKRILIVCNYFAPENLIAAVRITKLAKYFRIYGYEVEVLAEKKDIALEDDLLKTDVAGIRVHYAQNSKIFFRLYKIYKKMTSDYRKKRFERVENRRRVNKKTGHVEFYTFETAYPIIGSCDYLLHELKQWDLFNSVKKFLKASRNFDYIITSHEYSFAYFVGKYFHKHHKNVPWFFDLRDSIYRYKFVPDYVAWLPKSYERYIWENADGMVGVSEAICNRIPAEYQSKVSCITNGYDLDDRNGLMMDRLSTSNMIFSYTGSMYGGLQDLSAFFMCVRSLGDNGRIDVNRVEFHYAGNLSAFEIFRNQAETYGLGFRCINEGKLKRRFSLELQQRSDILLMASYDYKDNEGGVITGKALEYMAANRPVICTISGDIENSELARIIRKTNVGIVYEESRHTEDFPRLCEYVAKQYDVFLRDGCTLHSPQLAEIEKYNYANLSKVWVALLEKNRSSFLEVNPA